MGRRGEGGRRISRRLPPVSPSSGAAESGVEQLLSSSAAGPGPGAGGRRRGPGRRGLSTALPATRWFWLRDSRAEAPDSERLSQPPCRAGRWGRRGESAPPDRQPGSAGVRRAPSAPLDGGWLLFLGVSQPRSGQDQHPRCRGWPWPGADPALRLRTADSGTRLGFSCKRVLSLCRGSFKLSFQTVN